MIFFIKIHQLFPGISVIMEKGSWVVLKKLMTNSSISPFVWIHIIIHFFLGPWPNLPITFVENYEDVFTYLHMNDHLTDNFLNSINKAWEEPIQFWYGWRLKGESRNIWYTFLKRFLRQIIHWVYQTLEEICTLLSVIPIYLSKRMLDKFVQIFRIWISVLFGGI